MLFDGFARRAFGWSNEMPEPVPEAPPRRLKIGFALGGGAARGWAHIGVIRALDRAGIKPDVIAGTSMGAVVGGCYAAGKLDELESFARSLTKSRVVRLLDFHVTGSGLIAGGRLMKLLDIDLGGKRAEDLPVRFATVATELATGHELWLTRGPLIEILRASYALPGVFDPVRIGGRWMVDGALVNPVPVTVARALGADLVICVNLNGDMKLRGTVIQTQPEDDAVVEAMASERPRAFGWFGTGRAREPQVEAPPGIATVMIESFNIIQDRISRSRLAGDPPDIMIAPKLMGIGLFEFHRAAETIAQGEEAGERILADLREMIGQAREKSAPIDQAVPM